MNFEEYVEKFGPWDAHSVEYESDKFTIGDRKNAEWIEHRAKTYGFMIELFGKKNINDCKILDIGCFEGGLSYNLARLGADVLGIEIRDNLLGRCDFLKQSFPDLKIDFMKGDMLNLDDMNIGKFDAILMAGTLYHIDAPDIISVLRSLRKLTNGPVIIDTHISSKILEIYDKGDIKIYGRSIVEHREHHSTDDRKDKNRASFSNNFSFWPTENSLVNLIRQSGFDYCVKPMSPSINWPFGDRGVWVCGTSETNIRLPLTRLPDPDNRPSEHRMLHNRNHIVIQNPSTRKI